MSGWSMGKAELVRVLDVMSCSAEIQSKGQLSMLTDAIRQLVPFEFVGLGQFHATGFQGFSTTFTTYNHELDGIYQTVGYKYDPAISGIYSSCNSMVFNVDQPYASPKMLDDVKRDFGIQTCLSMGVRGEHEFHSYVVCSNYAKKDEGFLRVILGLVAPHVHLAISRCRAVQEKAVPRDVVRLSPAEDAIVRWLALGKSNWEIAVITNIAERTVRFHLSNIFERAHVSRRAELIAYYDHVGSQLIRRLSSLDPSLLVKS